MPNPVKPLPLLTATQVATLRLVYCGLTSKQIARRLGTSHYTIDERTRRSVHRLGLSDRGEAARWAMAHVPGPYERLVYELLAIAPRRPSAATLAMSNDATIGLAEGVAETQAVYFPPSERLVAETRHWNWGNPDDLSPIKRAGLILVFAFLILAIVFTLLAMGEKASDWASQNLPEFHNSTE